MTTDDLLSYLKTQFSDLDGAKKFMRRWVVDMGQMLPIDIEVTSRALAAHCSAVLEGSDVASANEFSTNYMASKYGSDLFWSAWDSRQSI